VAYAGFLHKLNKLNKLSRRWDGAKKYFHHKDTKARRAAVGLFKVSPFVPLCLGGE
jgi:hypothetical protein